MLFRSTRHFSPDCPTVTISGIGSLQVTRGGGTIGRIEAGEFVSAHPEVFTPNMLGKYLYRLINIEIDNKSHCFKNDTDASIARTYMSCIKYLMEILAQRKIGATIILAPDVNIAKNHFDCSWGVSGSLEVDVLQKNMIGHSNSADSIEIGRAHV